MPLTPAAYVTDDRLPPTSPARGVNHRNLTVVDCHRPIPPVVGHRPPPPPSSSQQRGTNLNNLTQIDCSNVLIEKSSNLKVLYLNARSCKNKTIEINDLIVESNADVIFISETWLKDKDNITVTALLPNNFDIVYRNRKFREGGGVAIIYRNCLKVLPSAYISNDFSSFESCYLKVQTPDSKVCFFSCIYRPPNSDKFRLPFSIFIHDFNDLCKNLSDEENVYILGDFNIHFEKTNDKPVNDFKTLIDEHYFKQCINEVTHIKDHTIDLLLCLHRCADEAFTEFPSVTDKTVSLIILL